MDAPLHGDDHFPAQGAHDEVSFMPCCGGNGETGQLPVGDDDGVLNMVCQTAQAAAQNNAQFRLTTRDSFFQARGNSIDIFYSWIHDKGG